MKLSETIVTALFVSVLSITLPACEEEGPLEEAGEEIGDTIEDAGDAVEDAADDAD